MKKTDVETPKPGPFTFEEAKEEALKEALEKGDVKEQPDGSFTVRMTLTLDGAGSVRQALELATQWRLSVMWMQWRAGSPAAAAAARAVPLPSDLPFEWHLGYPW